MKADREDVSIVSDGLEDEVDDIIELDLLEDPQDEHNNPDVMIPGHRAAWIRAAKQTKVISCITNQNGAD